MSSVRHATIRVAALASLCAGVVHAFVVADHAATWWVSGAFFALLTAYQLGWGLLALLRPSAFDIGTRIGQILVASSLAVNGGSAVLWAMTRWVTGEPFGPQAGTALPIGPAGIASTLLELVAIVALVTALRLPARPARGIAAALLASGLVLAAPTAWGVNGAMAHDHGSHVDDHGDDGHDEGGHDEGGHDEGGHDEADPGDHGDAPAGRPKQNRTPSPTKAPAPSDSPEDSPEDVHEDDGHGH